jgi:methyl-accepting chemotaxis protein
MKLGTKIIAGFASLIIIAILLGSMAIWKMSSVKTIATTLAGEYMPATGVANNVERESLSTMYEMRGYAFTEDTNMLAKANANLAIVKKYLQDAKDLATKPGNENLAFLKQAAEKAEVKALEYDELVKQTVAVTENLEIDRQAMDVAAQEYMKVCSEYLDNQNSKLQEALKTTNSAGGVDMAAMEDRIHKMSVANEIIDLGNAIRIGNFKSQATRNPDLFRATQKKFDELNPNLDAL